MSRSHKSVLPITKGMHVRVPRGTTLRSTHPRKDGPYQSKRAQTVLVHHVTEGYSSPLGSIYEAQDGSKSYYVNGTHWRTMHNYCQKLGVDHPYSPTVDPEWLIQQLLTTGRVEITERVSHNFDGKVFGLKLRVRNPTLYWAGTGGYWVEAEMDQVQVFGWFIDCDGVLHDLSDRDRSTFCVESHSSFVTIHVGVHEEGEGFRVDDSYVYHAEKPDIAS